MVLFPCLYHHLTSLNHHNSEYLREPFAEFLGVAILILFGDGVVCQVVLSANTGVAPTPKGVSFKHLLDGPSVT